MAQNHKPPKPIKNVVRGVLKSWGLGRLSSEQRVFEVWKEAMGEPLCRHARPVAIHNGTLVIAARDSAWMQELQFMKGEIKKKLNRHLGPKVIHDVRFKIGSWKDEDGEKDGEAEEAVALNDGPELDPSVVAQAEAAASVISDPRLREQMLRTLLASAGRGDEEDGEDEE